MTDSLELKTILLKLIENRNLIPPIFYPNKLQLTDDIYLSYNGHIHVCKKGKKENEYNLKKFFIHYSHLDKKIISQILDRLNDLLLFVKAREDKLTARDIIRCRNAEIRRLLLEMFGYEKFVSQLRGRIINRNGKSELILINWHKDEELIAVVKVQDSTTGANYILRVHPTMRTCKEAIAWTFNMDADEYHPLKET